MPRKDVPEMLQTRPFSLRNEQGEPHADLKERLLAFIKGLSSLEDNACLEGEREGWEKRGGGGRGEGRGSERGGVGRTRRLSLTLWVSFC